MTMTILRFTTAAFAAALLLSSHVSASTDANLRRNVAESSCNDATNQESCLQQKDSDSAVPCQWCVAGAIPSECMSQDQASLLPSGVFECIVPGFNFVAGKTHSLDLVEREATSGDEEADGEDAFCDASSASKSGYMDIKGSDYDNDGEDKHLFFWMFEKRSEVKDDTPFIVWLTGGPGCSSTLALLTENGPCKVNEDGATTTVNPYSWTETAHVLWLDQPAGVGFSYGSETDSDEEMVGEDAYYFLQAFFQTYPEYASNPLYIVGESYGGHYAPAIAHRVMTGNKQSKENTIQLNLAGLGVGNGLTNPEEQYKWYPEMVFNNSHHIQVVDEDTYNTMQSAVSTCTSLIHKCNQGDSFVDEFACQSAFIMCNTALTSPYQMTGLNPYDIRKKCEVKPLCYDFSHVSDWLNKESTKKALGVDEKHAHSWQSCNFGINSKFRTDWMKDFSGFVSDLLDAGIPALIYAGDVDFICNYLGNKAWTLGLEWDGKDAFNADEEHSWKDSGLARTAEGLTFLQVFDAGHMVPADQPAVALDMIANFVTGGVF